MSELCGIHITPKQGGFIVRVAINAKEFTEDEYIVTTYAKLMKALKDELSEFKPVKKQRVDMEIQKNAN